MKPGKATAAALAIAALAVSGCAHVETSVERDALAASLRPEAERRLSLLESECMRVLLDGATRNQVYIRLRPDTPDAEVLGAAWPEGGSPDPVTARDVRAQYAALVEAGVLKPSERKGEGLVWFDVVDQSAYKARDGYCYGRRTAQGPITLRPPRRSGSWLMRDVCFTYVFSGVPAWANDPRLAAFNPKALRTEGQVVEARLELASRDDGKTWEWLEFDPRRGFPSCG